jgi:zinc/manganese transport system substrate-binding protein
MKRMLVILSLLFAAAYARAEISVVATYPYIADIASRVGGGRVRVTALAPGNWDPHRVVPKPSMIARIRNADLLVINGAELEIGWLPPLVRESGNAAVRPGSPGLLDLSRSVKLIDVPSTVSRSGGDVHPSGNPHFHLDPLNIPLIAGAVCRRLCELDPKGEGVYRKNLADFNGHWGARMREWDISMARKRGARIVEYHTLFRYFTGRYGIVTVGYLEPLPGIPPASRHLKELIDTVKSGSASAVVADAYHPAAPARFVSEHGGVRLIVLPHDVGALPGTGSILDLFDTIVRRMTDD